jgi:hypothetical protein
MDPKHVGSTFDSWLEEEGLLESVTADALRRVLERQERAADLNPPREASPLASPPSAR